MTPEERLRRAAKSINWVKDTLRKVAAHRSLCTEEQMFNQSTLKALANSLDPDCNPVMEPLRLKPEEKESL